MKALMLIAAGTLAFAPIAMAQDHAVSRGGGGGGGGGSSSGGGHPSASSGGSSSSSSGSGYSGGSSYSGSGSSSSASRSTAERRHPRGGTGRGDHDGRYGGGGYYYYPSWYGSYWYPYGAYGWYGGYWGGPYGYMSPWGGGTVYHYVRRETGAVRVLVEPSEARVYVDGYYAGVVDDSDGLFQRLNVSPGRHEITLKLEGYKTHRMKVYVPGDSTLKLRYDMQKGSGETFEDLAGNVSERELRRDRDRAREEERWESGARDDEAEPALGGRLKLKVKPADASIYIDGAFRGTAREIPSTGLSAGRHRVEIVRPGYRTVEKDVEVEAGETSDLSIELDESSI